MNPNSIIGLNLYVYCENNPTNLYDEFGHIPTILIIVLVAVGTLTLATSVGEIVAACRAESVYDIYKDTIVIERGRVLNSSQVTNIFDVWALSMYIRYHSNDNIARGSGFGIFIEWMFHNVGANLFNMKNGDDLDYSSTLFCDFIVHNELKNIWQPILMSITELVFNPIFFTYDIIRTFI